MDREGLLDRPIVPREQWLRERATVIAWIR
jgi:hypothetical protein